MPHVEIHSAGIREKAPVPRRLVVPAMMQVQYASMLSVKNVVADLVGKPRRRMIGPILIDEESVLRFKPKDAIQHEHAPQWCSLTR